MSEGSVCAPSLLIGLINTLMFKPRGEGFVDASSGKELPNCHLNQWYPGQANTEAVLIGLALACIPIMLFGKPFAFWFSSRKVSNLNYHEDAALVSRLITAT